MAKRDLILNNFSYKVTALALAVLVWLTFHRSDGIGFGLADGVTDGRISRMRFQRVPLTVMQPAGDMRRFTARPLTVDVEVSGDQASLQYLHPREVQAFVDVGGWRPDRNNLPVRVYLPPGLRAEGVLPAEARVELIKP